MLEAAAGPVPAATVVVKPARRAVPRVRKVLRVRLVLDLERTVRSALRQLLVSRPIIVHVGFHSVPDVVEFFTGSMIRAVDDEESLEICWVDVRITT